ncbi:marine proteobacterial sortase target protein [Kangiella sp. TOML190]|uniref:marine proteobacterial sortase target protein n=1 Tax=Kangiella sp. TOML190 TaxID=2931351 RepID=UPI0020413726|nr:marine proteobacterial sortase target protein [Kangiella sp. TOML190]
MKTFFTALLLNLCFIPSLFALGKSRHDKDDYSQISYRSLESGYQQEQLPLSTDISVEINGVVARTQVIQTFSNQTGEWLEGVYKFPLPENAVVDTLKMIIGEQVIEGEIQEKQQAEATYQKAKLEGKKASLVRQERPNLFTTKLANIAPYETIKIHIEFQQLIHIDDTEFSFKIPLGITPRYQPQQATVTNRSIDPESPLKTNIAGSQPLSPQVSQFNMGNPPDRPVNFTINLNAGFELAKLDSPHHSIKTEQKSNQLQIKLDNSIQAERDFILKWQPKLGQEPQATLLTETLADYQYHLLVLVPPAQQLLTENIQPREMIFVVDSSGSMSGQSMQQAKAGLEFALRQLNPGDSFNIIDFDSNARKLFSQAQEFSDQSVQDALTFINSLQPEGGTEIAKAVDLALTKPNSEKLRQIIFLTDGSIGNEQQVFSLIHNRLGNNRLFTIGIGAAPNSYFMSKAAEYGRGTFTYISSISKVEQQLQKLFSKLRYPVLSNLSLNQGVLQDIELQPKYLRDLYLGEPLYASYRTPVGTNFTMELSGETSGRQWQSSLPKSTKSNNAGVAKLWARMKIASLKNEMVYDYQQSDTIKQQILNTALDFHLVSDYTSLVAVDKTPHDVAEKLKQIQMKNRLAAGWQKPNQKTHGYPQGGTLANISLAIGALSLLLALVYWLVWLFRTPHPCTLIKQGLQQAQGKTA